MFLIAILLAFLVYCLLSLLLRLYPELIHAEGIRKRKSKLHLSNPGLCHISHRGGAGENLENTIGAFEHAHQLCTDIFEIDCHLTKDGYVVVVHDNHLLRLCGEDIYISETAFKDLPPLLCTQRLDFNHNFKITKRIPENERRILSLDELFEKYPKMPMNIDIKVNNAQLIQSIEQLVLKHGRRNLTIWGTSSHATTKNIRATNNDIASIYSLKEVSITLILYYTGLLPFVPLYADFFEIPMFSVLLEHSDTFTERTRTPLRRLLIRIFDFLVPNRKLMEHLKRRGIPTYMFVLNSEHEWKRAADCAVSGIMTDFPTKLRLWMKTKHNKAD